MCGSSNSRNRETKPQQAMQKNQEETLIWELRSLRTEEEHFQRQEHSQRQEHLQRQDEQFQCKDGSMKIGQSENKKKQKWKQLSRLGVAQALCIQHQQFP